MGEARCLEKVQFQLWFPRLRSRVCQRKSEPDDLRVTNRDSKNKQAESKYTLVTESPAESQLGTSNHTATILCLSQSSTGFARTYTLFTYLYIAMRSDRRLRWWVQDLDIFVVLVSRDVDLSERRPLVVVLDHVCDTAAVQGASNK